MRDIKYTEHGRYFFDELSFQFVNGMTELFLSESLRPRILPRHTIMVLVSFYD